MLRTSVVLALLLAAFSAAADDARTKAIQDATVLVDQGKLDEAIAALTKLSAAEPADALAAYELALAYAAKGDNANCRKTLEPLVEMKSAHHTNILGMLGNCLDQLGETDKAIASLRALLALVPDSIDDGLLLAETQTAADRRGDALATLDEAVRDAAELVFVTHSLPLVLAESSPYVEQHQAVAELVAQGVERATGVTGRPRSLTYCSRSGPPCPSVRPTATPSKRKSCATERR